MYTRCPTCLTCFRVTEHHLAIAEGKVRCGQCQLVFNATEYAIDNMSINQLIAPASSQIEPSALQVEEDQNVKRSLDEIKTDLTSTNKPIDDSSPASATTDFNFELNNTEIENIELDNNSGLPAPPSAGSQTDSNEMNAALNDSQLSLHISEDVPEFELALDADFEITDIDDDFIEADEKILKDSNEDFFSKLRDTNPFETSDILQKDGEENPLSISLSTSDILLVNVDYAAESFATPSPRNREDKPEPIEFDLSGTMQDDVYNGESFEIITPNMPHKNSVATEAKQKQQNDDAEMPLQLRDDLERLKPPIRRRHRLLNFLLIIFLLALSFLQLAYFRAFELTYAIPDATPYIEAFCEKVHCHYSGPIDTSKIQLLSRDVRVHPKVKNALLISAAMINNADFPQPYPKIKIRLSDIAGNIIAERVFSSKSYMGEMSNQFSLMKSKIPVHVNFEVVDPGKDAVNYEFDFL
jgi:predicted Zn finger-like uncharacterized protein